MDSRLLATASRVLLAGVAALALALTVPGCGGGDDDDPPTAPPDRIVFIAGIPTTIAADGTETSTLLIQVLSLDGLPIDGAEVGLETDLGVFVGSGSRSHQVTTGANGEAFSALRGDGQAGTATVTATSGGIVINAQIVLT